MVGLPACAVQQRPEFVLLDTDDDCAHAGGDAAAAAAAAAGGVDGKGDDGQSASQKRPPALTLLFYGLAPWDASMPPHAAQNRAAAQWISGAVAATDQATEQASQWAARFRARDDAEAVAGLLEQRFEIWGGPSRDGWVKPGYGRGSLESVSFSRKFERERWRRSKALEHTS